MRLFVAIAPPPAVLDELDALVGRCEPGARTSAGPTGRPGT